MDNQPKDGLRLARLTLGLALISFISATSHSADSCDVAGFFRVIHMKDTNLKNLVAEMKMIRNEIHDRLSASELAKFDEIIDKTRKLLNSKKGSDSKGLVYNVLLIISSVIAKDLVSGAIEKFLGNE